MTGQILDYSIQTNTGAISGDDGNRYTFSGGEWQEPGAPRVGTRVDFAPEGNVATGIYSEISSSAPPAAPNAAAGYSAGVAEEAPIVDLVVASSWHRIAAYLLESVLAVLTLGIGYLIWLVIVMARGQTPGKQLMGIHVVRLDGSTASWGLMFGRGFCKFLSGCIPFGVIISFIMMLADDQCRTIHDRMVSTLVVRNR